MSQHACIPCPHPGCSQWFTDLIDFYNHRSSHHQTIPEYPSPLHFEHQQGTGLSERQGTSLEAEEYGYGCPIKGCDATFAILEEVLEHISADHQRDDGFPAFCTFVGCNEYFDTSAAREAHMREAHGKGNGSAITKVAAKSLKSDPFAEYLCKFAECAASFETIAERDDHIQGDHNNGTSSINIAIPTSFAPSAPVAASRAVRVTARTSRPNDPPTPPHSDRNHGRPKARCPTCRRFYANLSSHIGRVHRKEKTFQCIYCDDAYFGAPELRKHCRESHGKPLPQQSRRATSWRCPYCDHTAVSYKALTSHINAEHSDWTDGEAW